MTTHLRPAHPRPARRGAALPATTALLSLLAAAAAATATAAEPIPAGETVQWTDNGVPVRLVLAYDRLDLDRAVPAQKSIARASNADRSGHTVAVLADPADSRAALATRAAALAAATGAQPTAVLYDPTDRAAGPQRLTRRLAIHLAPGQSPAALATAHGLTLAGTPDYAPGWALVDVPAGAPTAALDALPGLLADPAITAAVPMIARRRALKHTPDDPLFALQWHLHNDGTQVSGAVAGNDLNVLGAWDSVHGEGVNLGIVDTGIAIDHPDLAPNAATAALQADFFDTDAAGNPGSDPRPPNHDASGHDPEAHGTVVAGLAAARGDNDRDANGNVISGQSPTGVCGVAYRANLVAERLIAGATTDQQEAGAEAWHTADTTAATVIAVKNNSWGAEDDGVVLGHPGSLLAAAVAKASTTGRGGRGVIFTWAGGNGGEQLAALNLAEPYYFQDNASYDGYVNELGAFGVAASDSAGQRETYSEPGVDILVNAPGGGGTPDEGMISTDRLGSDGFNTAASPAGDYTSPTTGGGGTSYAAPLVAGVCALMLDARPQLTKRDVEHILARTAVKNDPLEPNWFTNGAGFHFDILYGFGRVDASAAVADAATAGLVPAAATDLSSAYLIATPIPNTGGSTWLTQSIGVTAPAGFRCETIELNVIAHHPYRGDLRFELTSPSGTVSVIPSRPFDNAADLTWTFKTYAHWGENPTGTWSLKTKDEGLRYRNSPSTPQGTGVLNAWSLTLHGFIPYPAPQATAITPTGITPGAGDTTLTVAGSGFAVDSTGTVSVTTARVGSAVGTLLNAAVIDSTHLSVTIPGTLTMAPGALVLAINNPAIDGAGGGNATIAIPLDAAPAIAGFTDLTIPAGTASATEAFTVGDADTALASLTVTPIAADAGLLPATAFAISGSGATRVLTITPPTGLTGGPDAVTVTVSDGQRSAAATFNVIVGHASAPPATGGGGGGGGGGGCGLGGGSGVIGLLLGLGWLARRRRRV
jgi:subtilisin-like proprotein convertase family protein